MLERSSKAVDLPDKQNVDLSLPGVTHEAIEGRARLFAARDANVQILLDEVPITSGHVLSQFIQL
jgi:hypothetical protein